MKKIQIISDKNLKSKRIKNSLVKILNKALLKKPNIIMVIGGDGFHQYSYDCENTEISYISTIPIERL